MFGKMCRSGRTSFGNIKVSDLSAFLCHNVTSNDKLYISSTKHVHHTLRSVVLVLNLGRGYALWNPVWALELNVGYHYTIIYARAYICASVYVQLYAHTYWHCSWMFSMLLGEDSIIRQTLSHRTIWGSGFRIRGFNRGYLTGSWR